MAAKGNRQVDRTLTMVVQVSSAISLGTLAGVLYSVKSVTPSVQFSFTGATLIAFSLAAMTSVAFWHVVFKLSGTELESAQGKSARRSRAWLVVLATALGLALLFSFILPLRDLFSEKSSEIASGAGVAVIFLALLGVLFWRVVRFLENQS